MNIDKETQIELLNNAIADLLTSETSMDLRTVIKSLEEIVLRLKEIMES
jgi:hypothetical protein